jgi:hypothetical protein
MTSAGRLGAFERRCRETVVDSPLYLAARGGEGWTLKAAKRVRDVYVAALTEPHLEPQTKNDPLAALPGGSL